MTNTNTGVKGGIFWIAKTAIFIALLIVFQAVTAPLGQYVTGSLVNLILIVSAIIGGVASGSTVALVSPLLAFMLGIGPKLFPIIPIIMLGNLVIVLTWHFIVGRAKDNAKPVHFIIATIAGALLKFAVLFVGVGLIMIPFVLKLPEPQATVMKTMFSFPQIITAVIGGVIASPVIVLLRKALKNYI